MSPGGLAALLLHHRVYHPVIAVGDSFRINGRRECQELGLINKRGGLTQAGKAHLRKLCDLPISDPEVKL